MSLADRPMVEGGVDLRQQLAHAPFPAPKKSLSSGTDTDILSPADSVFAHQDSASSEDYKSAPEHTPSPDRSLDADLADLGVKAAQQGNSPTGEGDVINDVPTPQQQQQEQQSVEDMPTPKGQGLERVSSSSSPQQNTEKISAFHKSLSDLAHTFSSILISEDEKEVLQSAE